MRTTIGEGTLVRWSIGTHLKADLVNAVLAAAIDKITPADGEDLGPAPWQFESFS